jgi:hypothetical protein
MARVNHIIELQVLNFETYNPRKDRTRHHYSRIENDIWESLHDLDSNSKLLFIFLITNATKYRNSHEISNGFVSLSLDFIQTFTKVRPSSILVSLSRLEEKQLVKVLSGNQAVTKRGPREEKRREEKEEKRREEKTPHAEIIEKPKLEIISSQVANANLRGCIESFKGNENVERLLAEVKHDVQKAWLQTYPTREWIFDELLKANTWIITNPHKKPKQFARFMTNWLNRGFENYRKNLPSNFGMTSDGFYLTPEMKRGHNLNLRVKNLTGKTVQEIIRGDDGNNERIINAN